MSYHRNEESHCAARQDPNSRIHPCSSSALLAIAALYKFCGDAPSKEDIFDRLHYIAPCSVSMSHPPTSQGRNTGLESMKHGAGNSYPRRVRGVCQVIGTKATDVPLPPQQQASQVACRNVQPPKPQMPSTFCPVQCPTAICSHTWCLARALRIVRLRHPLPSLARSGIDQRHCRSPDAGCNVTLLPVRATDLTEHRRLPLRLSSPLRAAFQAVRSADMVFTHVVCRDVGGRWAFAQRCAWC
ncbi:hypothetical protein BU23DRAFT_86455 [Bimuria novae-zelandiae CBS 107.79]|uniref:Uncharacterized protein n=1 Tax=Bimuria novae-zelandiae CBS 107.79 TaxID=1447943 RepID=A0A6A5VF74_9PLEO|nr:hypothetical protein BU23DRAFT_86455 [Bimuria novae-zelandiae CBS 107.79]